MQPSQLALIEHLLHLAATECVQSPTATWGAQHLKATLVRELLRDGCAVLEPTARPREGKLLRLEGDVVRTDRRRLAHSSNDPFPSDTVPMPRPDFAIRRAALRAAFVAAMFAALPAALRAIRESGGWADAVSDAAIVDAIRLLAETEGIFTETAGGVTVAVQERPDTRMEQRASGADAGFSILPAPATRGDAWADWVASAFAAAGVAVRVSTGVRSSFHCAHRNN